uniref:Uncharacterized protein n=1 Tax=Onchocerca volvulus TaxID=6282 RepID=A0A8R1TTT4_ONCVO
MASYHFEVSSKVTPLSKQLISAKSHRQQRVTAATAIRVLTKQIQPAGTNVQKQAAQHNPITYGMVWFYSRYTFMVKLISRTTDRPIPQR